MTQGPYEKEKKRIVGFARGYGMRAVSSPRLALLDGHSWVLCRARARRVLRQVAVVYDSLCGIMAKC